MACIRQAIRLMSHSLCRPFVGSPKTSAYLARSWSTVIRSIAATSLATFSIVCSLCSELSKPLTRVDTEHGFVRNLKAFGGGFR